MLEQENQSKIKDEALAELTTNHENIDDGIWLSRWKEWDGEIVILDREATRWVWKQLKKIEDQRIIIDELYGRIAEMQDFIDRGG